MEEYTPAQTLLKKLKDERCGGVAAQLAIAIGKDKTYVNRLFYPKGKKGRKGIGLEIMQACTRAFELPAGFWEGVEVEDAQLSQEALRMAAQFDSADPVKKDQVRTVWSAFFPPEPASSSGKSSGSQSGTLEQKAA